MLLRVSSPASRPFPPYRFAIRLFLLLSVCGSFAAGAADTVNLRLHPTKGQIQKLNTTIEQKVTNTINGTPQSVNQSIGLGYRFETLDVAADDIATVKVTFDTITFKQTSAVDNIEYDSANPPAQIHPRAKGFAALAGQTFIMNVAPSGKISQITGLDAMVDSILKKLDLPQTPAKPVIERSIRREFGEDAVRDNMEIMFALYPDKPVSVGQSWTRKISMSKGIPLTMENTFTLKEVTGDVALLALKGKLASNPDAAPLDLGSHKISYLLAGDLSGTMKVSKETGWILAAEMNEKFSGDMTTDLGADRTTKTPISAETKIVMDAK